MKDALKTAIDSLEIQDVYVSRLDSWLEDSFDPKYSSEKDDLLVQYKHLVEKSEILELKDDDSIEDSVKIFKVSIVLGARWILNKSETKDDQEIEDDIKAQIETKYILEYIIKNDIDQKCLDTFALNNASYHVWPYWRELLMTQCLRMNLPKLALPTLQLASNRK